MTIKQRIKDNLEREKVFKEHRREPWRATGRTSRALFDLCSRYPDGEYYFICHSGLMRDMCMRQFIEMMVASGAPIKINRNQRIISLKSARYRFVIESNRLRERIHPDATILEDHCVGEARSAKISREIQMIREQEMKEEAREASRNYITTRPHR